jgi:hypothetical protein
MNLSSSPSALSKTTLKQTSCSKSHTRKRHLSLRGLFLGAQTERRLAPFKQARLLVRGLAFADRTLLLRLLLARAERDHVALAAATPVVSASGGFGLGVVAWSVDVLCEARVVRVIVGDDVALAWLFKSRDQ